MMKTLILNSNWRARVAIVALKSFGREPAMMAELRDALNQRSAMRAQAKFSLWYMRHEDAMRERFNVFIARHPFRFGLSSSLEKEWNDFVTGEYKV